MFDDDVARYKKKATKKSPPKAKHKHEFEECILEYPSKSFDKTKGFIDKVEGCFGRYCVICGRIHFGGLTDHFVRAPYGNSYVLRMSEKAKRELNPETRTLPTFWVDGFLKTKYIDLESKKEAGAYAPANKEFKE